MRFILNKVSSENIGNLTPYTNKEITPPQSAFFLKRINFTKKRSKFTYQEFDFNNNDAIEFNNEILPLRFPFERKGEDNCFGNNAFYAITKENLMSLLVSNQLFTFHLT